MCGLSAAIHALLAAAGCLLLVASSVVPLSETTIAVLVTATVLVLLVSLLAGSVAAEVLGQGGYGEIRNADRTFCLLAPELLLATCALLVAVVVMSLLMGEPL